MNSAELLRDATAADAEADRIFAELAREAEAEHAATPGALPGRPIVPSGGQARAERASDLRRRARHLRAHTSQARPIVTPPPPPAPPPPPVPTVDSAAALAAEILANAAIAKGHPLDPVEVIAARIIASEAAPPSDGRAAEALAMEIVAAAEAAVADDVDVEAAAQRILDA